MADSDFSVYARIQADTSNFEKGMKNAQTSASNLSKSFGNLSKVITKALSFVGVVFSAKAIADFGKTSVQSATQATKQFKILDNTVKATGADAWTSTKQLEGLAKELSNATNYSVTELEEMQSVLLGFRNITDDTFSEASEAILDMATVMGMDLKSAAQTVGKALDDPIKGLDSLRRQGFQFTDEQKEELAQLVKNGEQIKAQKIILDELAQSYGGAAKAGQDSFAKQRHAMENLKDELGGKLIPVLQVFAEENAKVLDALREKIEQMDFSKAVNVVTNLKNIFAKRFEEIKQRVVVAKDSIVDFLKRFNFGPVVSILDTLIGHLVETVKMFREMQVLNFGSLKEGLIELSNSEAFEKFVTFFNAIIDVSHGILEEVKKAWPEIRDAIVNVIINIWDKIKEFFEKLDEALNGSGNTLHLWADLFWKELDNIYRIAQDLLKGVTHLLKGDWAVAWEYAKLAVLRVADGVLDAISTIANGMPKIINKIINEWNRVLGWINKGLEKLNKDPIDLVPEFKSVDLSDVTGVADKIEEVENKIQELTGAAADNGISHLDKLSGRWKGFTSNALGEISALTEGAEEAVEKTGDSAGEFEKRVQTTFAKVSEWDSKLLSQKLNSLKEYESEYLDIQKRLIEEEKEKDLEKAETEEDRQKIELYYLNELAQAEEKYHKAVAEKYADDLKIVEDTKQKILEENKEIRDKTLSIFKDMGSNIGSVFSHIGKTIAVMMKGVLSVITKISSTFVKGIKTAFNNVKEGISQSLNFITKGVESAWSSFKDLVELNLDDALISVLKFEDSVLTFFYETLPQLPSFLNSVFESVVTTIGMIISSINVDNLTANIEQIILSLTSNLPAIVEDVLNLVSNLFANLITIISQNAPNIFNMVDSIFEKIGNFVTEIIPDIINKLGQLLPTLITWLSKKFVEISDFIGNFFENLANNVNLGEIIDNVVNALENGVEQITESISNNFPKVMGIVTNFIQTVTVRIPSLISNVLPNILNALDVILDTVENFISEIAPNIINILAQTLPTLITWLSSRLENFITFIGNLFEEISAKLDIDEIINNLMESLLKGLKNISESILENLPKILKFIENLISDIADKLPDLLEVLIPTVLKVMTMIFTSVTNILTENVPKIVPVISKLLDENLPDLIKAFVSLVTSIATMLPQIIIDILPTLIHSVTTLVVSLVEALPEIITTLVNALPDIIDLIIKEIPALVSDVLNAVLKALPELITILLTKLPDIIMSLITGIFNLIKGLIFDVDWAGIGQGIWDSIVAVFSGIGKWFEDLWNVVKVPFEAFGKWFKNLWNGLKTWFKNLWDGFLDVMKAPINAIIKAINVVIDGLNKVSFSIPDWVPLVGGKKFGISIPNLQELAVGTQNAYKGLTLVGEAGPELVNFRGGEQVLNNHNTNKALENMGGNTNNFNVTFNNLQDTTAFAMIQQLKQYNRQMAINSVF